MKTSKKIFLAFAAVFLLAMAYIGYDISSRTTFPGSKPQLKERLLHADESKKEANDTLTVDSLKYQK